MITTDFSNQDAFVPDSITIRALSSITVQQAYTITQAVYATGQAWDVHITNDYDGYLSIFIEPSAANHDQKSFFVFGTANRFELFASHGDDLSAIAVSNNVQALSDELCSRLDLQ